MAALLTLAATARAARPPARPRRRPQDTVLYRVLAEHLETFLDRAPVPPFVARELRGYLRCGILAHGFLRVFCSTCRRDELVAFSCKGRGFCPSCGGRRMADTAAHLVDRVLPEVPVRQWVLTVPFAVRYLLAFDSALCCRVRGIFVREVLGFLKDQGLAAGLFDPESGAVTFQQRFGSSLNLNLHYHSLVLDGVFHSRGLGEPLGFRYAEAPDDLELARLLERIRARVLRLLRRRGLLRDDMRLEHDPLALDEPTLAACYGASLRQRIGLGPKRGAPLVRLGTRVVRAPVHFPEDGCAVLDGFSLHGAVRIAARDRGRLERLARYGARPPLGQQRLALRDDGQVVLRLKSPWQDGTTGFVFEPLVFVEKLAALVPPPRAHLVVYHGILAPGAARRSAVVPRAKQDGARPARCRHGTTDGASNATAAGFDREPGSDDGAAASRKASKRRARGWHAVPHSPSRPRYYSWPELIRRTFLVDVLRCGCGARRQIIATITHPPVVRRILECLGMASDPPFVHPARAPPSETPWLYQ